MQSWAEFTGPKEKKNILIYINYYYDLKIACLQFVLSTINIFLVLHCNDTELRYNASFQYIYIIEGEEITVIAKDLLRFLFTRQKSLRLNRLINEWTSFVERMKQKSVYDPYWLEREIINTPTWYDHPAKYQYIIRALSSSPRRDYGQYDDDDGDDE